MSGWRSIINNYLADLENQTTATLERVNADLLKSGQHFNTKIKEYFIKSVKSRLDQTVEGFEIQMTSDSGCSGLATIVENNKGQKDSEVSSDGVEILETPIKCEILSSEDDEQQMGQEEGISTSCQPFSELENESTDAIETEQFGNRNFERLSFDSNFSMGQRSTCSSIASNAAVNVMSPVDYIKREPSVEFDYSFASTSTADESKEIEHNQRDTYKRVPSTEPSNIPTKRIKLDVPSKSSDAENQLTSPDSAEDKCKSCNRKALYICFYCQRDVGNKSINLEPSDTIEEMKSHWDSNHASKPFLYYVIGVGACFYCEKIDTYPKLQNHHNLKHSEHPFIVVDQLNRSKCGLCHEIFTKTGMQTHFKSDHNPFYLFGTFSPICFTQKEIDRFIRCNPNGVIENPSKVHSFICGHCGVQCNAEDTSLKQHYEKDIFQFQCTSCEFTTKVKQDLFVHEKDLHNLPNSRAKHFDSLKNRSHKYYLRTKLIFSNGLVLFNHNLLNTKFDDRRSFWSFVEHFATKVFAIRSSSSNTYTHLNVNRSKELENQRKFRNNLCISGIGHVEKKHLLSHFIDICDTIGVPITSDDIETIFKRKGNDVIVKLSDKETKKKILKAWNDCYYADTVEKLRSIKIENDLSGFFKELWEIVENAKEKQQIFSFWISEHGLTVKKTQSSKSTVVWSKKCLMRCISDK